MRHQNWKAKFYESWRKHGRSKNISSCGWQSHAKDYTHQHGEHQAKEKIALANLYDDIREFDAKSGKRYENYSQ